jgi:hypothetical protein
VRFDEKYRVIQEEKSIFWEVIVSVIVRENQMNMYLIVNGCRDGAVSIYRPKSSRFLFVDLNEERCVQKKGGYTRRIALSQYG